MKLLGVKPFYLLIITVIMNGYSCKDLRLGKYPDNPVEVDLDVFLPVWLKNAPDIKIPLHNLVERSRDSVYIYFFKNDPDQYLYIKVPIERLTSVDYLTFQNGLIGKEFYEEIIPEEIKNYNNEENNLRHYWEYDYSYIDSTSSIEIKCHYIIRNFDGKKIRNEYYTAIYNIKEKSLKKN